MPIKPHGKAGILDEVDTTLISRRATIRPNELLGWHSVGATSGLMAGIVAAGTVFSFRNIGNTLFIIRRVGVGFLTTTAFTTPQVVDFGLTVARSFVSSDSGGTQISIVGSNIKYRTNLQTPMSIDCRIAAAVATTNGTRTLDVNDIGQAGFYSNGLGAGSPVVLGNLYSHDAGDYALILQQNEGVVIRILTSMGAAGVGRMVVGMEFENVASY
jgi:hypothetical protein